MKNTISTFLLCICLAVGAHAQDAVSYYNQGIKLKESNQISEALAQFRKAIALNPKYSDALYQAGWCQNDLKEYSSAITYLQKARQFGPAMAKLFFELGYAFEKTGKTDSALHYYGKCLEMNPGYSLAYKQLGTMAYMKDDYNAAITNYTKYEENAKAESKDYMYWYRKGFSYNALKDYANANTALLKSLALNKENLNTYLELGFAASKRKLDDEAIGYFKTAMNLDPKSHIPINGIAEVYRDNKKDCDEAMNWYRKSLQLNPTERKACYGMGYCFNTKEQFADAIGYLKTAIENEPAYTAAYIELGYAYYRTDKFTDAETCFNKAIELSPKNENARYYACLMYVKQKNKAKAQRMVDELKALSSKHVATLQPKVNGL